MGQGSIIYKETIASVAEGVGHFEPLRHYAEVHLILEPGEPGSGLQFDTCCSEDELDRNWQRLILTHLEEKQHKGVLTRGEITDMKITLAAGRLTPSIPRGEISGRLRTGLCARPYAGQIRSAGTVLCLQNPASGGKCGKGHVRYTEKVRNL